jgi:protein involved in polysaccharide export with SLBB domain
MMSMLLFVTLTATVAAAPPRPTPGPMATPAVSATAEPAPSAETTANIEYRVGAGDVLDIVVVNDPQFSRPAAVVQTNGMITIPLVGDIAVASLTVPEIRIKLTRLLDGYLVRPQVEVKVGEIVIPRSDGTFSGGEKALRVHVGRNSPTAQDLISLQMPLRHLDLIQALPKYYVNIDGEVARSGRYVLEPELTVTGLISMAGGLTKWAKNDVKILRRVESSAQSVKVIEVNFKDVRKGKKPDVPLEPNDIVSVGRRLF